MDVVSAKKAFALKDPETGKMYIAQTSYGIIDMLWHAVKGAEANWADNPVENIWRNQ